MLIGGIAIALMQAVKLLSYNLHPFIITLYRAALVFIVLLPVLFWQGFGAVKTSSIKMQIARGAVGGVGMLCVFTGLSIVSLAEATALLFTVPIFATLLAVVFLSEKVGVRRWSAILIGFGGIIIITRPDASMNIGHLYLIFAAISWSTSILIAKKLTEKDTILSITFWQAMGCVPLAFVASLFVWGATHIGPTLVFVWDSLPWHIRPCVTLCFPKNWKSVYDFTLRLYSNYLVSPAWIFAV